MNMHVCTCPTCGQPTSSLPISGLAAVQVGGKSRRMLDALVASYPRPVSHTGLLQLVYGDDPDGGPLTADHIIGVMACRLRKELRKYGWTISHNKSGGAGSRQPRRLVPINDGRCL